MKKIISSLLCLTLLSVILSGCFIEADVSAEGLYEVWSDDPVIITFTTEKGETKTVNHPGGEWWIYNFTLDEDSPDPFWFTVKVVSTEGLNQRITIYAEFEDDFWDPRFKEDSEIADLELKSFYCAYWTTQCGTVSVTIR